MGTPALIATVILSMVGSVRNQFMGYPYDYSSMFSGYTGYNPMMSMTNTMGSMGSMGAMNTMGMNTGFGTFGTGLESLYGAGAGQQAFGAYNPYGNGMFNFGNNNMFGQNAYGTGFNNNMFGGGGANNGLLGGGVQQVQQGTQTFQNTMSSGLNNGNTMRAYGRRSTAQNFNNNNGNNQNYAPTRVGQMGGGCGGGFGGGGCGQQQNQQGWNSKAKKV